MKARLRHLLRERDERNNIAEQVLSVYRDHGVVPKADRDDNFNKTPEDLSNYKLVCPGDVVVNKMKAWQGSIAVSSYRGVVSGDYLVCEVTGDVDMRFLHHLLRSRRLVAEYVIRSKGIRPAQWRLYWDDLADIVVNLPHMNEQRLIADYLDAETARVDGLAAKKRRLIDVLTERRTAVMLGGVSGRFTTSELREAGLPWLANRGADWPEVRLTLVASLGSGHTPSRDHPEWWVDCTVPWITTGEVAQMRSDRVEFIYETRESISELGLANSSAEKHPRGTVVLCRTASAGYSAILGTEMATSQDFATWTCTPLLQPRFLLLCLRAMRQDLLGRLAMGSTHKTIYMPDIQALRIPLPPVDEQDRIVESVWSRLNRIDQAIDRLQQQIRLLREHRHTLITAVVTGELEVPGVAA